MTRARRGFAGTRLGQVHWIALGASAANPVVLLHQTPRSADEFAEVQPLVARERPTIALDTPGYGCSDPVTGQPEIADYAAAVAEALDQLGVRRAFLVGHHTGALIAIELAASHPERVDRVALSGPIFVDAAFRSALRSRIAQWRVRPDGSHLAEKWTRFLSWAGGDPGLAQRALVDLVRAGERSEQGHVAATRYSMEERLPRVRCPGLLIYGSRDPFPDPAHAARFAAAFSPCRQVSLEGGVFLPNEQPAAFAHALLEFA